jgi:DNA-binding CsgD family transcriptional regulator
VLDLLPFFGEQLATSNGLTPREVEVLSWVVRPRTLEKLIERIPAKLGVENRTTAAVVAAQDGPLS